MEFLEMEGSWGEDRYGLLLEKEELGTLKESMDDCSVRWRLGSLPTE
jgi:hypothetical protein